MWELFSSVPTSAPVKELITATRRVVQDMNCLLVQKLIEERATLAYGRSMWVPSDT